MVMILRNQLKKKFCWRINHIQDYTRKFTLVNSLSAWICKEGQMIAVSSANQQVKSQYLIQLIH